MSTHAFSTPAQPRRRLRRASISSAVIAAFAPLALVALGVFMLVAGS